MLPCRSQPDRAAPTDFITYGSMLRKRKLLRRVVLDECHLSFTASDYRPKLQRLGYLQVLWCPIILPRATLPPIRLDELQEVMHISDFCLTRMSIIRANIRCMVRRYPSKSILKLVKGIARLRHLEKGEHEIFHCSSGDRTEEVARIRLYCHFSKYIPVILDETHGSQASLESVVHLLTRKQFS
jgi:superfamily II DNA helicase RecQ